jgi:hypothetical protein
MLNTEKLVKQLNENKETTRKSSKASRTNSIGQK